MTRALSALLGALVVLFCNVASAAPVSGVLYPPTKTKVAAAVVKKIRELTDADVEQIATSQTTFREYQFDYYDNQNILRHVTIGISALALDQAMTFYSDSCIDPTNIGCGLMNKFPKETRTSLDQYKKELEKYSFQPSFPGFSSNLQWSPQIESASVGGLKIQYGGGSYYGNVNNVNGFTYTGGYIRSTQPNSNYATSYSTRAAAVNYVMTEYNKNVIRPNAMDWYFGSYVRLNGPEDFGKLPAPHSDTLTGLQIALSEIVANYDRAGSKFSPPSGIKFISTPADPAICTDSAGCPVNPDDPDGDGQPGTAPTGGTTNNYNVDTKCTTTTGTKTNNQYDCNPSDTETQCNVLNLPCNLKRLFIPRNDFIQDKIDNMDFGINIDFPVKSVDSWSVKIDDHTTISIDFGLLKLSEETKDQLRFMIFWGCLLWILRFVGVPFLGDKQSVGEGAKKDAELYNAWQEQDKRSK